MSGTSRFERRLHIGLDEIAEPRFPDYYDDVLAVTSRRRQRPAWTFPGRWIPMVDIARRPAFTPTLPWRAIVLLVALLLALVVGLLVVGSASRLPTPFGPARNGLIAFDTHGDVYVGDPLTGASRLVLDDFEMNSDPAWSRDGTLLAFVRAGMGVYDSLMVVKPDGSGQVEVTPAGGAANIDFWDWGPDSSSLFYVSKVDGVYRLFSGATDGGGATVIAPDLEIESFSFRPPDAQEMIVRTKVGGVAADVIMSLDGGERRTLVTSGVLPAEEHDLAWPRWSPDGTRVAYQIWDTSHPDWDMRLHVVDADGENDRLLHWGTASFEGWPVWSPDSKRLVIQRAFPTATDHLGFGHAFAIVNADGSGEPVEISPPLTAGTAHAEFSPDGTKVLMRTIDGGTQLILDPNGGPWQDADWTSRAYPSWQRLAP
jgi:Tol biopolymer transport system component